MSIKEVVVPAFDSVSGVEEGSGVRMQPVFLSTLSIGGWFEWLDVRIYKISEFCLNFWFRGEVI